MVPERHEGYREGHRARDVRPTEFSPTRSAQMEVGFLARAPVTAAEALEPNPRMRPESPGALDSPTGEAGVPALE